MNEIALFGVGFVSGLIAGTFIMAICVAAGWKKDETNQSVIDIRR